METERLLLRQWAESDVDALAPIFAEPAVWRFPFGRGFTREETEQFVERQVEHWATRGFGMWAAVLKADGRLIGYTGLSVPSWLPQVMRRSRWGGDCTRSTGARAWPPKAARAGLRYGFEELGLDRIIALVIPGNAASRRVTAKLGMVVVLETTDAERDVPLLVHEITRDAWELAG